MVEIKWLYAQCFTLSKSIKRKIWHKRMRIAVWKELRRFEIKQHWYKCVSDCVIHTHTQTHTHILEERQLSFVHLLTLIILWLSSIFSLPCLLFYIHHSFDVCHVLSTLLIHFRVLYTCMRANIKTHNYIGCLASFSYLLREICYCCFYRSCDSNSYKWTGSKSKRKQP